MSRTLTSILFVLPCLLSSAGLPAEAASAPSTNAADSPGTHETQLDAATIDARESLEQDILSFPLTADLTLGQFIDPLAGGNEEVSKVVQNARQRGGTRWTEDQTCEVRLEVSGDVVANTIRPILSSHAGQLPATREALEKGLSDLMRRTFSAVGKSTGTANLFRLRPGAKVEVWRNVTDAERREAILTAKSNAVAHVVQSLRPVPLGGNKTLDDALAVPELSTEIRDWIGNRPVTGIVFGDDLGITLMLSSPPEELWPVVQSALVRHHLGPSPSDGRAWAAVRAALMRDAAPAEGRSVAIPTHPRNVAASAVPPAQPDWVARKMDADGVAEGTGLKAARIAGVVALQRLRSQVEALPLDSTTTLGQAAKVDPRIARALDNVLREAPTSKVDYQQKGVVKVRVSVELEEVWRALYSER
jgi:hypothetical protein